MAITRSLTASASSNSDASSYTFSAQAIGAAASDRYVLVGIAARNSSDVALNSVSIGGVSATSVVSATASGSRAAFYIANVPTGTTGDVVVTFASTMLRCAIGVWRVDGLTSTTPTDSTTNTTDPFAANINISAGGAAFGLAYTNGAQTSISWTNLTSDASIFNATWEANACFASAEFATQQTALTLTGDYGAATSFPNGAYVSLEPGAAPAFIAARPLVISQAIQASNW